MNEEQCSHRCGSSTSETFQYFDTCMSLVNNYNILVMVIFSIQVQRKKKHGIEFGKDYFYTGFNRKIKDSLYPLLESNIVRQTQEKIGCYLTLR